MFLDYLFFKLLTIGTYERSYWAKIFLTCIETITLAPLISTITRFYIACNKNQNAFYFSGLLILIFNSLYYSPDAIRRLRQKYQGKSSLIKSLKLSFIIIILIVIFIYADNLLRILMRIPPC